MVGRSASGLVEDMAMLLSHLNAFDAVIEVHGGPWELRRCQVPNAHARARTRTLRARTHTHHASTHARTHALQPSTL